MANHQFVNQELMTMMRESLSENISGLVFSGNVWKSNLLTSQGFTTGMTFHTTKKKKKQILDETIQKCQKNRLESIPDGLKPSSI
jgi:hypothetical protein